MERITDAFFALDEKWRFTYLNSEAERVLCRTREDLLGKNVWEEFPEAVGSGFYREYHKAMAEQVAVEFEEYYPPLETWFEVKAYPSDSGLSVYFRDVSERRRAEEALKESERRIRAVLVQYSSDIITILEGDGTIRYESPAVEKVLGYRPEQLEGTKLFDHIHPDDIELVQSKLCRVLAGPGGRGPVEVRFRHADGSWRLLEGVGNNLLDDPGVRGIVINSRDVTERRRAEERLRASEAELRALFAAMQDVVLVLDAQGHYLTVASTDLGLTQRGSLLR